MGDVKSNVGRSSRRVLPQRGQRVAKGRTEEGGTERANRRLTWTAEGTHMSEREAGLGFEEGLSIGDWFYELLAKESGEALSDDATRGHINGRDEHFEKTWPETVTAHCCVQSSRFESTWGQCQQCVESEVRFSP